MTESLHRFRSEYTQNERSIWIREPVDATKPYHLAIFLDAELYRDRVEAQSVILDLEATNAIANTLIVFVSYESEDARWRECPCYPPFAAFIAGELLPWIEGKYPCVKDSAERVLIGLSYTGLAAAFVSLSAPGKFTKVIAQSGSFWSNECWLVEQFRLHEGRIHSEFYLDVGTKEIAENVQHKADVIQVISQIQGVRMFRDVLLERGYRVQYQEFDGGHDFAAWRQTLPSALRWALRPRI